MPDYAYVVLSGPVAGGEDAYNRWYSERHLQDVIAVPGFVSAQRFKVNEAASDGAPPQRYMAIYTMRTDTPEALLDTLRQLVESGQMEMSPALDQENLATILYEAITPLVVC